MLTIVIPVRIDCTERKENLHAVLRYLSPLGCRIIVLEADRSSALDTKEWPTGAEHVFIHDEKEIFHRTRYINILLHMANTELVAIWDTDVLGEWSGIMDAVHCILEGGTIAYPYNGQFVMLPKYLSFRIREKTDMELLRNLGLKPFWERKSCGGAFIVHRQRYLQCGGENEKFSGWGPEDAERWRRTKILGHKVSWTTDGQLYHLYHPRGKNSQYSSEGDGIKMIQELVKVCGMTRDELKLYISK